MLTKLDLLNKEVKDTKSRFNYLRHLPNMKQRVLKKCRELETKIKIEKNKRNEDD